MKKMLLILLALACSKAGVCQQLTITGTVNGAAKADSVEINVPLDGNYWKKNSTYLKPDATGNFRAILPYHTATFVILQYKNRSQFVLLSPGRIAHVHINAAKQRFSFSGPGKTENTLLQRLNLQERDSLSFVKEANLKGYKSYAGWSVDSVIKIKMPAIKHSLDSAEAVVNKSALPQNIKSIIAGEVKFYYAKAVAQDLGTWLYNGQYHKNYAAFHTRFIDTVWATFGIPTKQQLDISINANSYLDNYFRFKLWKGLYFYKLDPDKKHADSVFRGNLGASLSELSKDPDRGNEIYLFSTRLKTALPPYAWQKYLANELTTFCMGSELMAADKLLNFMKINCTESPYIALCEKTIAPLKKFREQYAGNLNIKIRPDYRNITSLKALLAPYKGKVVFVDMWGTWCPHCIEDMAYGPELKKHFKDKDVVFLYLANDEDKNDEKWRDFIFINNVTGEHVRRTTEQMGPLWNELGVIDSEQGYPHYFIIDKAGNIIINNAKRPSDGALYSQLAAALNK